MKTNKKTRILLTNDDGIYAAARALNLDFIPVVTESYDLVIPEDFLKNRAIEIMLETHPEMQGRFTFVQISAPSRTKVHAYQEMRKQIEQMVGHINGRFGGRLFRDSCRILATRPPDPLTLSPSHSPYSGISNTPRPTPWYSKPCSAIRSSIWSRSVTANVR